MVLTPTRHADDRGYFVETYNQKACAKAGITCDFVQDNQSLSTRRGTIRGLHFQAPPFAQAKLVSVVRGAIFDVAVDLRRGSSTYGKWCGVELSAEDGRQLFVPVGFGHAFCTLEPDTVVSYKVDSHYSKESEGGLRWDDPDLAIAWPVAAAEVSVSEKDGRLPFLRDFVSPFTI
jgi:dTDP-4-dehydrorhamnose 3,5-epimerase